MTINTINEEMKNDEEKQQRKCSLRCHAVFWITSPVTLASLMAQHTLRQKNSQERLSEVVG